MMNSIVYLSILNKVKNYILLNEDNSNSKKVNLIPYRKGDRWGFCDTNKNILIECKYFSVNPFKEGMAVVKLDNDGYNYNYIDETGNELRIGILHHKNEQVLRRFAYAYDFCEGVAKVCALIPPPWETRYAGYIDKNGNELISCDYWDYDIQDIDDAFCEGFVRAKCGKWGFLDKTGNKITSFKYDDIKNFHRGRAKVCIEGKWGYIDTNGREIFPIKLDETDDIIEERARICINGKYGFLNTNGDEIINCKYDYASPFFEGLSRVLVKEKKIVSDNYTNGTIVINGTHYIEIR
jgi:hypothetical protein